MTATAPELPVLWSTHHELERVLEGLALRTRSHCAIERAGGRIAPHALADSPIPQPLADAVLRRSTQPLTAALVGVRTLGLIPGGPALAGRLAGSDVTISTAPIVLPGNERGWLWFAGSAIGLSQLAAAAAEVATTCRPAAVTAEGALDTALAQGLPLPMHLRADAIRVWLAAVGSPIGSSLGAQLHSVLDAEGHRGVLMCGAGTGDGAFVVICDDRQDGPQRVQSFIEHRMGAAEHELGQPLAAVLAGPAPVDEPLGRMREQVLEAAAARVQPHRCLLLSDCRSEAVLRRLTPVLAGLPVLGRDPVAALQAYDDTRGGDLTGSLLAWLDAHGDSVRAAERLVVHVNTMRYRLGRAKAVLDADLDDPAVRLEVHLRLRAGSALQASAPHGTLSGQESACLN